MSRINFAHEVKIILLTQDKKLWDKISPMTDESRGQKSLSIMNIAQFLTVLPCFSALSFSNLCLSYYRQKVGKDSVKVVILTCTMVVLITFSLSASSDSWYALFCSAIMNSQAILSCCRERERERERETEREKRERERETERVLKNDYTMSQTFKETIVEHTPLLVSPSPAVRGVPLWQLSELSSNHQGSSLLKITWHNGAKMN